MDDARIVRRAKRFQHLLRNLQAAFHARRAFEPVAQGFAFHQLGHHVVGANVVERADMGMVERGDRPRLPLESLAELLGGEFDGDDTAQAGVQPAVDRSHAALAQRTENLVRTKPCAWRQVGRCFGLLGHHSPRGPVNPGIGGAALCEQGFHLPAQFSIALTGFGQEAISLSRLVFHGQMIKPFDFAPAFAVHGLPSEWSVSQCYFTSPFPAHAIETLRGHGPPFAHPIPVETGEIVERDGFIFADVLAASLL